ncbi:DUF1643 domain-containing protein [Paenibacillus sp. sptzw28]|uniref:DUF1643 domain-containing protein n=1 Tax=Paenibacillus sp. sptzw28 TaxID=715179 RepID=UPI001C6F4605|nr:DUF1643 domain-containing protein [Paenibacillus sp. sptzw28]
MSTDPKQLKSASDPERIVLAWGEKHLIKQRNKMVARDLLSKGHDLYCLGIAESGHPRHPSRMSHSLESLQIYQRKEIAGS